MIFARLFKSMFYNYRHPKKYEVPALPTGNYAPEPITAKPGGYKVEQPSVVYGKPEINYEVPQVTYEQPQVTYEQPQVTYEQPQVTYERPQLSYEQPQISYEQTQQTYEIPQATYEPQAPPAPIENPIFESAPVQDLTSLAAVEEYEQPVYTGYSQVNPGTYQSTHHSNHLAQEVQSGSVYVQHPQHTVSQNAYVQTQQPTVEYESQNLQYLNQASPQAGSSASFSIHVNGQSHGFSHNTDHALKS